MSKKSQPDDHAVLPGQNPHAIRESRENNDPRWESEYQKLGTTAGAHDDWHEAKDPSWCREP